MHTKAQTENEDLIVPQDKPFIPPSKRYPLISTQQLADALSDEKYAHIIKLIDCSWLKLPMFLGRNPHEEFKKIGRIQNAVLFDIDECCDKNSPYPHMLPSPYQFAQYLDKIFCADSSNCTNKNNKNNSSNSNKEKQGEVEGERAVVDRNNHHIVLYDSNGIFSAPRVWWTFKVFGYDNVSVLDGGLPKWIAEGRPIQKGEEEEEEEEEKSKQEIEKVTGGGKETRKVADNARFAGEYSGEELGGEKEMKEDKFKRKTEKDGKNSSSFPFRSLPEVSPRFELVSFYKDIKDIIKKHSEGHTLENKQLIDARSPERFFGGGGINTDPRSLPTGHMPSAKNLPYYLLLNQHHSVNTQPSPSATSTIPTVDTYTTYKSPDEIEDILKSIEYEQNRRTVCTCGSGVTASIVFLALHMCGIKLGDMSVYDGSWTEYIQRKMQEEKNNSHVGAGDDKGENSKNVSRKYGEKPN